MISEFSAAVQSVKALKEVLTAAHELKDSTALIAAVNEVHGKLVIAYENVINSQEQRLSAQQKISELEKEITEIMNWKQETERYALAEIGKGVFAFVVKTDRQNGEPSHKLCTACFEKRQKGYLNLSCKDGRGTFYKCNVCGSEICCFAQDYLQDLGPSVHRYDYNPLDPEAGY
ncbi:hypothetical protein [Geobacter sp. DSM 9736]|uniref:hypothetical protein n=1 Tax=Geobacter sp. DSM 9736 TaxID=1277350 RepID=UPI000B50261A|nr:hypothetical protein [Geobacter sp. DSM 9736]SNB46261.1 hypothetical protein SAMN06269301_1706 [Geobacter sp. DSM 9736]